MFSEFTLETAKTSFVTDVFQAERSEPVELRTGMTLLHVFLGLSVRFRHFHVV